MSSVATAYEPLLERHIGRKVVIEQVKGDKVIELVGVLKDYTADFIEVMDIDYTVAETDTPRKADIILRRACGIVRHLAE